MARFTTIIDLTMAIADADPGIEDALGIEGIRETLVEHRNLYGRYEDIDDETFARLLALCREAAIAADPATVYQYWRHRTSGEVLAVELTGGQVTGVCGPLHYTEVTAANLPQYHYHDEPEDIDWLRAHADEFMLHEVEEVCA